MGPFLDRLSPSTAVALHRGIDVEALDMKKRWTFHPAREFTVGSIITGGDIYGMVEENELINHAIMFYPGKSGRITVRSPAAQWHGLPPLNCSGISARKMLRIASACSASILPPAPTTTSKHPRIRETHVWGPTQQWIASIGEYTLNDDVIEIENVAGQKERFTMLRKQPPIPFPPVFHYFVA